MSQTLPPQPANQPIRFKRDPETGLEVGREYRYTPEGFIDWRAMVPARFLYVPDDLVSKAVKIAGKPLAEIDLLTLPDNLLRVRIAGLNYLIHVRGVRACTYPHMICREGHAATCCELELIPNCEAPDGEIWSGQASACRSSMDVKMLPYLETFAENRAFGRAIKRALQINILTDIETGGDGRDAVTEESAESAASAPIKTASGVEPWAELERTCNEAKPVITFEKLKEAAIKLNAENPPSLDKSKPAIRTQQDPIEWSSFKDIQHVDAFTLIGRIKQRQKEAAEKAAAKTKTVAK